MGQLVVIIVNKRDIVSIVPSLAHQVYVFNTTAQQQLAMQQSGVNTVPSLDYVPTAILPVQRSFVLRTTPLLLRVMVRVCVIIVHKPALVLILHLHAHQVYVFNTTAQQQLAMQQLVVNTVTSLEYVLTPLLLVQ